MAIFVVFNDVIEIQKERKQEEDLAAFRRLHELDRSASIARDPGALRKLWTDDRRM